MNARELGTTLAALRAWQDLHVSPNSEYQDIATDGGEHEPLSGAEIDALCERLNVAPDDDAPLIFTAAGQSVITASAAIDALAMFVRAVDSWQDAPEADRIGSEFIALIETTAENARNVLAGQA
jgi:hypothetical protein